MDPVAPAGTAVVLGGGGLAGLAWQIGILAGLHRAGRSIHKDAVLIGTSAGASVAALLSADADLDRLAEEQASLASDGETRRPFSLAGVGRANRDLLAKVGNDLEAARQRIGAHALRASVPSADARLAAIRRRIGNAEWGDCDLRIVATDAVSGDRAVFASAGNVSLATAVAASSAVPGTWPPVRINGRAYVDGGVYSLVNADLAAGAERVHVIAPFGWGDDNPVSGHLRAEVTFLERHGSHVTVIVPDDAAGAAMSDNVLDPARRSDSVAAGLRQAAGMLKGGIGGSASMPRPAAAT